MPAPDIAALGALLGPQSLLGAGGAAGYRPLRQGHHPVVTLQRLAALCGIWRSTVKRWQRYFRDLFPESIGFLRLRGRLLPPIDAAQLPGALLARFYQNGSNPEAALISCLKALALGP